MYICSVPKEDNWTPEWFTVPMYIIDFIPHVFREDVDNSAWAVYQKMSNYNNIWIIDDKEFSQCVAITNIKWHKGEVV